MFEFTCPHCGEALAAEDEWAGMETECPTCGTRCVIPAPQGGNVAVEETELQSGPVDSGADDAELDEYLEEQSDSDAKASEVSCISKRLGCWSLLLLVIFFIVGVFAGVKGNVPFMNICARACAICGYAGLIAGIIGFFALFFTPQGNLNKAKSLKYALIGIACSIFVLHLPLFQHAIDLAKEKAQDITCVNNLKQAALSVRLYTSDNDDFLPVTREAALSVLTPEEDFENYKAWQCPIDGDFIEYFPPGAQFQFILEGTDECELVTIPVGVYPNERSTWEMWQRLSFLENQSSYPIVWCPNLHRGGYHVGFADGHVETVSPWNFKQMLRDRDNEY